MILAFNICNLQFEILDCYCFLHALMPEGVITRTGLALGSVVSTRSAAVEMSPIERAILIMPLRADRASANEINLKLITPIGVFILK